MIHDTYTQAHTHTHTLDVLSYEGDCHQNSFLFFLLFVTVVSKNSIFVL